MSGWLEVSLNVAVTALVLGLLVKYRDRPGLRYIGESKRRFRAWLSGPAV